MRIFRLGKPAISDMIAAMSGDQFGWKDSKGVARAILRDRVSRRRLIARLLLIALVMMGAGLWLLEDILSTNAWWFLIWWGACAVTTLLVMMFALYDGLAVMREEREKHR